MSGKKKDFILVEEFVKARASENWLFYEDFVSNSKTKLYSFG